MEQTSHFCVTCAFAEIIIRQTKGSGPKELTLTCKQKHAPVWLFTGRECEDFREELKWEKGK